MDFTGTLLNKFSSLPAYWWLWLIVVALVVWLIDGRRITPRPLLAAYILFILMETIIGRKTGVGRVELVPFWSYSHPELRMEIVLNYILFIPLGCLLYLCFGEKYGLKIYSKEGCYTKVEVRLPIRRRTADRAFLQENVKTT